jgi:hypothetical protein
MRIILERTSSNFMLAERADVRRRMRLAATEIRAEEINEHLVTAEIGNNCDKKCQYGWPLERL